MSKSDNIDTPTSTVDTSADVRLTGRVKWFNNKAGFGFVTVLSGEKKDEDVFVHHSGIVVASEQYKYLVQGEYFHSLYAIVIMTITLTRLANVRGVCNQIGLCVRHVTQHEFSRDRRGRKMERKHLLIMMYTSSSF